MAEKDATEGRCPACRTPYNKEKIVGTAASCERLVSEMNVEKKLKSHKGKSKSSEGRKQLASVRVIQRNLVYVVGLPLSFADEDLLQRREYFGQYGKVLKVSISRTAAGAIQQFANSTCSVYITYSKEEEAVRCIQSVHGFVLDSRPLRQPCSNPDCLYLHEIGSNEDSFTKDEIISAYTRIQQSVLESLHQIAALVDLLFFQLEPHGMSSGCRLLLILFAAPFDCSIVRGTRASNNQPLPTSTSFSNGPVKQKPDVCNGPVTCSTAAESPSELSSLHSDTGKTVIPSEESISSQDKSKAEASEKESNTDGRIIVSESSYASVHPSALPVNRQPHGPPLTKPPPYSNISLKSGGLATDKDSIDATDGNIENICSDILSMGIHNNQVLENGYVHHIREPLTSQSSGTAANIIEDVGFTDLQSDFRLGMTSQVSPIDLHEIEDDLLSFENQRLKDPEVATNRTPEFCHASHLSNYSNIHSPRYSNADGSISVDLDRHIVDRNSNLMVSTSNFPIGHPENIFRSPEVNNVEYSNLFPIKDKRSLLGRYEGEVVSGAADMGESSIISNILSIDFDPWEESLPSPQNMAKLLGESDKRQGSFGVPGSRKTQNNSQSRFSFAREEEPMNQLSDFGQSMDYFEKGVKHRPFGNDFSNSNSLHFEKFVGRNGFPTLNGMESETFAGSHSCISSDKLSVSRSQISPPPGFRVPSRAPPRGFNSHERMDPILDTVSGNHMLDASSLFRNHYRTPSGGSTISNGDKSVFMDPAIMAVGKEAPSAVTNSSDVDSRSNYSSQFSTYEEARYHQSFLQRSLPSHQNQRYNNPADSFSPLGDAYQVPSRVMEQTLANNFSPFSQFTLPQSRNGITSDGQLDGWNEVRVGNNLRIAELLRNERLGFNKFYGGYEDSKIRMPSSGNLYNGTYGI
ncbi:hypothetical protein DH2020_021327 [Rehmannia glutinosa]|uniref:RRM domain-containing protein n=1 Tax=Rehmannia glutinosa TaxID=99300 RepID=A0ABR0WDY8_REHGL